MTHKRNLFLNLIRMTEDVYPSVVLICLPLTIVSDRLTAFNVFSSGQLCEVRQCCSPHCIDGKLRHREAKWPAQDPPHACDRARNWTQVSESQFMIMWALCTEPAFLQYHATSGSWQDLGAIGKNPEVPSIVFELCFLQELHDSHHLRFLNFL